MISQEYLSRKKEINNYTIREAEDLVKNTSDYSSHYYGGLIGTGAALLLLGLGKRKD